MVIKIIHKRNHIIHMWIFWVDYHDFFGVRWRCCSSTTRKPQLGTPPFRPQLLECRAGPVYWPWTQKMFMNILRPYTSLLEGSWWSWWTWFFHIFSIFSGRTQHHQSDIGKPWNWVTSLLMSSVNKFDYSLFTRDATNMPPPENWNIQSSSVHPSTFHEFSLRYFVSPSLQVPSCLHGVPVKSFKEVMLLDKARPNTSTNASTVCEFDGLLGCLWFLSGFWTVAEGLPNSCCCCCCCCCCG